MRISEDYVISSNLDNPDIPDSDLWTFLKSGLVRKPEAVAIIDATINKSITYKDFQTRTENLAANLHDIGFDPKHPLVIYMPNCIEYAIVASACWILGGTVAALHSALNEAEINKTLTMIGCEFMCCHDVTVKIAIAAARNTSVKKLLLAGDVREHNPECTLLSTLIENNNQKSTEIPNFHERVNPKQDVAMLLFSSGTTGLPKAVEMTHYGVLGTVALLKHPGMDYLTEEGGGIYFQPFSHLIGMLGWYIMMVYSKQVIIMSKFNLEEYVKLVAQYKTTVLFFVPPIAVLFSKSDLAEKYDLSHVNTIFCGAAPLGKSTEDALTRMLGDRMQVRQVYGMTETGMSTVQPSLRLFPDEPCPSGSVGLPAPGSTIKIVDVESGKALSPGNEGEIWTKSDFFMKGYRGDKKATDDTIDSDGWLHTGDVGYCDGDGYLFVVDRLKELIKYKAFQVAPAELEALLLTHPGVADSGVIGLPDEECGELPHAWVVRKPNVTLTEREITDFVNSKVAYYKKLRGGVKFVDAIPKSPTGKILRKDIKRLTLLNSKH